MRLTVGERLTASGLTQQPGAYVVTGVVSETAWHGLYRGKKVFHNFDFSSKRPRETDDKEWLDVLLRTIEYPIRNDAAYIETRRTQARAEARQVLGNRCSNLWPEPIDLLEVPNTRDSLVIDGAPGQRVSLDEPIVVFAQPHGQTLAEWQQNVLPLASLLSVLAEILAFLEQAHAAGLVLNGLGPGAVLVDRAGRVHYVGTDMVFAEASAPSLDHWPRFYPPQRYALGFAPPECVERRSIPDRRSDVYAWGSIAYFLLTGDKPGRLAQEQGRAWAHFQEGQFGHLEKALRTVPPAHVRDWAEQLGVEAAAFVAAWPGNLLALFRLLLHPDPHRRPASVAELRGWALAAPPPPVAAAIAIREATQVRILIDLADLAAPLDLLVRRGSALPPDTPKDGERVYEGPLVQQLEDRTGAGGLPAVYGIFTRRRRDTGDLYSLPAYAEMIDAASSDILGVAESAATGETLDQPEPPVLKLLIRGLGEANALGGLLNSNVPVVRAWAIRSAVRLSWPADRDTSAVEPLLWRALQDPLPSLRLEAARAIVRDPLHPDPALIRRVVNALGGADLDERIQAAHSLRRIGLDDYAIERAIEEIEGDRPALCPVCRAELARRDRPDHLRDVHGFVDVFGALLPRQDALARLWERVFSLGDTQAHDRVFEIVRDSRNNGDIGPLYVSALEDELRRRSEPAGVANERLLSCLRRDERTHTLIPELLRARNDRVREIGRVLVLAEIARDLGSERVDPAELRLRLDRACPDDLLEEKIILCLRLPNLGVDLKASNACLALLQEERSVVCTECRARVKLMDLESHLRQVHGIFEFRGVRRSYREMKAFLVAAVCGSSPDHAAWKTLTNIARERHSEGGAERLVSWLGQALRGLEREQRLDAVKALAEVMAASGSGAELLPLLASSPRSTSSQPFRRHLALEVVTRMLPPLPSPVVETIHPLLGDKQLPREARQAATASLLRTTGKAGPAAEKLLTAFVADTGKLRAIEKLHLLEQYVGQAPAIDALCAALEDQVRMNCPRCAIQLRRAQMVGHLWDRHRLVLEGRRVREPWHLIEDWLEDYRLEKDAAVLERCRELAARLDPDHGVREVQRLLLRHGIEDREALTALLDGARRERASLCPHCYESVPATEPAQPVSLMVGSDSLEGHSYYLELSENGLRPRLRIDGPDGTIYDGREPGRLLTRNGALLFVAGPLVLLSFFVTEVFTARKLPLVLEACLAAGVGLFVGGLIFLLWPVALNLRDRLVDCAWNLLIAGRDHDELSPGDAAFVAGLAQVSAGWGNAGSRLESAGELCTQLDSLARANQAFVPHLAAVWRLRLEDILQDDEDEPLDLLAEQIGHCFEGKLPLYYAVLLLHGLPSGKAEHDSSWPKTLLKRLPIILCERAFAAGLELSDVTDLGQAYSELRWALTTDEAEYLAKLRLLWSMRLERPWERAGEAMTAFEVAASSKGSKLLGRYPDLLLAVEGMPLFVCSRGICFENAWFDDLPTTIEVRSIARHGHELIVGSHHFRYDVTPEAWAASLEKWFRWYFRDFLPQVPAIYTWRDPQVVRTLQSKNGVRCPECKRKVLPRLGEVGVTLDEKVAATWI